MGDYAGAADQKIGDLTRLKVIPPKFILDVSKFRDLQKIGESGQKSDIEDLFDVDSYLELFTKTFAKELGANSLSEADLPAGDRIVERLERWIDSKSIPLRPSGGFNHYRVSAYLSANPPQKFSANTLNRFEALFKAVNQLYS